ncbi:MAG: peptidoglycan binding domain-containing protein, partial [Anaerolineae bacterium]|nr:peptidoglycan binding domain-containing protein [Anaerolineae bacterium]
MMVAGAVESGVVVPGPRRTFLLWGVVVLLLVILGAALFFCAWVFNQRLQNFYRDCIFPNVYILGEDLGGYSSEAAADVLAERVAAAPIGQVIMTDGERQWSVSWEEAGLALDIPTTLQLAMAEGRAAAPLVDQLRAWTEVREISPVFTVDLEQARQVLEALSGDVSIPPVDARIGLQGGEVVLLPGEMGRVLDVTDMLGQLQAQSAAPEG